MLIEQILQRRFTATSEIRLRRYYGHIVLAAWQNYHTFSLKTKTSLILSTVNKANLFWPTGDHINGVPLYM